MYIYLTLILAFILRLINLNQSLWLDEATVAKVVKTIPFHLIPTQFSLLDFHPPLYYMFMSVWGSIFGSSAAALRMPSILFSLLAGWYVFKIGSQIKDRRTGLWAAIFFLFNPLIIYYSQEARMYMMATAFLSIALYYFLLLIKKIQVPNSNSKVKNMVFFNIFSALAILTFYGSIFFIGGMIIVNCVISTKRNTWRDLSTWLVMIWGLFLSLLLLSPLLLQQLQNAKVGLAEVKNWSLVLGKAEIKNFAMIFLKFATGRISWYPKWSYYLAAGIPTVITWIIIIFGMKKNKLFAFLFIVPLLFGYAISFWVPMMQYFRFLYLVPVMSVLLGLGVTRGNIKGVIILSVYLVFSLLYLFNPQFHREDWKKLAQDIHPSQPVYMILPSSDPITYYGGAVSLFEMRNMEKRVIPEYIQVIPYVENLYGYNHSEILRKKGCVRESLYEYRGPLFLEKWRCPTSSLTGHAGIGAI